MLRARRGGGCREPVGGALGACREGGVCREGMAQWAKQAFQVSVLISIKNILFWDVKIFQSYLSAKIFHCICEWNVLEILMNWWIDHFYIVHSDSLCLKMKSSSEYFVNIYWSLRKNLHQQSYKSIFGINPCLKINVNWISKNKRNDPKMTSVHFKILSYTYSYSREEKGWPQKN